MPIMPEAVPGLKRFLRMLGEPETDRQLVLRLILAFLFHIGRMSCSQAAGAIRPAPRHRAQITRFLAQPRWKARGQAARVRRPLLAKEARKGGRFLLLVDATLCSQQGSQTENAYSTGNRKRRPKKGRRYGQRRHTRRQCHSFLWALLITPSGTRIPYCCPHRTKKYCQQQQCDYRSPSQAVAGLIHEVELPDGADVMVIGDAAFDAQALRQACEARGFHWLVPCNPQRVLAGPKPRSSVRSLLKDLSPKSLQTIKLLPGQGKYVAYRRLSRHRLGRKAKPRTYYAHEERRCVQSIGDVRIVFSTTKSEWTEATLDDTKILLTNATLPLREIVELYTLRWQIELFFKELKSTLGFHQYRFRKFCEVEGWLEAVQLTFLYLEWYRVQQLERRSATDAERQWWQAQRTYGLCLAIRQRTEQGELKYLAERLETPGGTRKLKRLIRNGYPQEYRIAA
jgi:hypothetical protein